MSIANEIQRLQIAKTDIKNAIENKGVTVGDGTIDTYAEKIDEIVSGDYTQGYEDGKAAEYDAFWDSVYEYIEKSKSTFYIFGGAAWNDTTFNPPRDIVLKQDARSAFRCIQVTDLAKVIDERGLKIDFTNVKHHSEIFAEMACERIGVIDYSTCVNSLTNFELARCPHLITIDKIKWGNNFTVKGRIFSNCTKLQNITFEGIFTESISFDTNLLLSNASVQSIIDALADLTGGTTQTLTVHADVYEKIITNGWDARITAKNWTLVSA